MGTVLLTKFNHEEYWTEEYEKFNTLPRDNENTNLFNVGTNVLTHHMSRNSESTHTLENSLYGTMKKWALSEVGHA